MSMDHVEFRKNINAFFSEEQSDAGLNEFLLHLRSCPECREELEINYIVIEGLNVLDDESADHDLTKTYEELINSHESYISIKKVTLTFRYIADTLIFWALLALGFYFINNLL